MIEQRTLSARSANYGSEVSVWAALAAVWGAQVDTVNTRQGGEEHVDANVRVRSSLTQILIRYRSDVTSDMRINWPARNRLFQIVGLAEVGRRDGLQLSCEEYSLEPRGAALISDTVVLLKSP